MMRGRRMGYACGTRRGPQRQCLYAIPFEDRLGGVEQSGAQIAMMIGAADGLIHLIVSASEFRSVRIDPPRDLVNV
jgi:hypothetical protein